MKAINLGTKEQIEIYKIGIERIQKVRPHAVYWYKTINGPDNTAYISILAKADQEDRKKKNMLKMLWTVNDILYYSLPFNTFEYTFGRNTIKLKNESEIEQNRIF